MSAGWNSDTPDELFLASLFLALIKQTNEHRWTVFNSAFSSDQQQVEPLFSSGRHGDPVTAQQADFVVHQAAVAPQHCLQGLGEVHHGLQLRLALLCLPMYGLK